MVYETESGHYLKSKISSNKMCKIVIKDSKALNKARICLTTVKYNVIYDLTLIY